MKVASMNFLFPSWRLVFSAITIILLIIGCCFCDDNLLLLVNATAPMMLPLPSQIFRSRIPSLSSPRGRQQQQPQQLWLYEGALYDPLDGRQVAKVQGIELVRPVMNTTNLAIDSILHHPNATYEDAQTLWSQKIFCYTKTKTTIKDGEKNVKHNILRSVRIRPQSPRKDVPLDQAVAVYETATTLISRRRGFRKKAEENGADDDIDLLIHSEFPNGQTMWGDTQELRRQQSNNNPSSTSRLLTRTFDNIDFTIFAKLRSKRSPLFAPDLIESNNDNNDNNNNDNGNGNGNRRKSKRKKGTDEGIIVSPKRSALIQFGSSSGTIESKNKFGARETYSYRNIPSSISTAQDRNNDNKKQWYLPWRSIQSLLSKKINTKNQDTTDIPNGTSIYYTRYGEGPPFYSPGRMCMLELQGRHIYDLKDASPILQRLVKKKEDNVEGGGPVVGFHYLNNNNNEHDNDTPKTAAPPSIQTAWNLNEKKRYNNKRTARQNNHITSIRRRISSSSATGSQLLLLEVQDPKESVHDKNHIRSWARRRRNQVVVIWDCIRASTMLEAGNE